jgi:hypothetical protein
MNKKLIVTLISICFLTMGCIPIVATSLQNKIIKESEETISKLDTIDLNESFFIFQAYGPLRRITEIELLDGPEDKIQKINKMMSRRLFYPLIPAIFVRNLTFKISFDEAVSNRSRNWYATAYHFIENLSDEYNPDDIIMNMGQPHSLTVTNFSGVFTFIRPKLFRYFCLGPKFFRPYRFAIAGYAENVTENLVVL